MLRVSILFIGSLFIFLSLEGHLMMGSWLVFVMGYIFISEWVDRWKKMNNYENRFENIYVVSNHPLSEEEFWMGDEEFDKLIVRVDYKKVIKQVREEEKMLEKSGNSFYTGEGLSEKNKLKVIPIIFRDGENVNENWREFEERVRNEIMNSRKERHEILKKADVMYYHKYMNYQKGL